MQEADKIWNHFKGLRPVQKYSEENRYMLRMGTFTARVSDQIEFKADLTIDVNSLEFNEKEYKGALEDLLPEWLADYTNKIKKLHIKSASYETLKFVLMYLYTRFDYPIEILFNEFANWGLKGSKREWEQHNIRALLEWANENQKGVEIIQRNHDESALLLITKK